MHGTRTRTAGAVARIASAERETLPGVAVPERGPAHPSPAAARLVVSLFALGSDETTTIGLGPYARAPRGTPIDDEDADRRYTLLPSPPRPRCLDFLPDLSGGDDEADDSAPWGLALA